MKRTKTMITIANAINSLEHVARDLRVYDYEWFRQNIHPDNRVFDWDKAVRLIKENGIVNATAGLSEDMFYTSGPILKDGSPVSSGETYTFLSSEWATPVLVNDDTEEQFLCYRSTKGTQYNSDTYWPISALNALKDNLE